MKQYIDKAAVVAEINRRTKEPHSDYLVCLKDMLSFIGSLQEEPVSEDLEEAAKKVGQKYFPDERNIWPRPNYEAMAAEYAFKDGVNWQKEQMIDKACKWLKSYRQDTPDGTGYVAGIVNDKTIEEFKQAMEE